MIIRRIQGATRTLGKSQGFMGLPVKDTTIHDAVTGPDTPAMETAWEPTPDELEAIQRGASIILRVIGRAHPPVMLSVSGVPEPEQHRLAAALMKVIEERFPEGINEPTGSECLAALAALAGWVTASLSDEALPLFHEVVQSSREMFREAAQS